MGDNSECSKEQDEKKQKTEQNNSSNLRSKQAGKQVKDTSSSGEPPKENYVHVRAKRGQATNSHSLAERVSPLITLSICVDTRLNTLDAQFRF